MLHHRLRAAAGNSGSGYSIESGNKAPTEGSNGNYNSSNSAHSSFAGQYNGWTNVLNSSQDDASTQFTWQNSLTFWLAGVQQYSVYIGSNSYATFGGGSTQYSGLSASSPSFAKIFVGAADNSYQRLYYKQGFVSGSQNYYRIRFEGNSSTSGTVGTPGIVWEMTFFDSQLFNGNQLVELLVGVHGRAGSGLSFLAQSNAALATPSIGTAANKSIVYEGDSTGSSWTAHSGSYVGGTDY